MITVKDVLDALWELAPETCKEPWDNVGLLLGRQGGEVTKILVTLDATKAAADEAARRGCELVVSHHPILFREKKRFTDADPETEMLLYYLDRGLSVISMHTNLDCAPGGVNDVLAARLGLEDVEVLEDGETAGLVRMGTVPTQLLPDFLTRVRERLACPGLRYVGDKPVRRVAVGGGSCGDYLEKVAAAGCDTFVTADVKYHTFLTARALGVNLIDAGHFETEVPVCSKIASFISNRFPKVVTILSVESGCVRFYP